ANETREQRLDAILKERRPKIDATVRQRVGRAVDLAEAEEFGAMDFESRVAGLKWATAGRQASLASPKKGVHRGPRDVSVRHVGRQGSLVPGAAAVDGAWGTEGSAGALLLRPVPAEFPSRRRRAGAGGRDPSGGDAAGVFGRDAVAVCGRGRGGTQALCG